MRKEKRELMRLQNLIENDRLNSGEDFTKLLCLDLEKILKDYFDFRGAPELILEKDGDKYNLNISLTVTRVKNFNTVPNH